jgi:hypothetical protein
MHVVTGLKTFTPWDEVRNDRNFVLLKTGKGLSL